MSRLQPTPSQAVPDPTNRLLADAVTLCDISQRAGRETDGDHVHRGQLDHGVAFAAKRPSTSDRIGGVFFRRPNKEVARVDASEMAVATQMARMLTRHRSGTSNKQQGDVMRQSGSPLKSDGPITLGVAPVGPYQAIVGQFTQARIKPRHRRTLGGSHRLVERDPSLLPLPVEVTPPTAIMLAGAFRDATDTIAHRSSLGIGQSRGHSSAARLVHCTAKCTILRGES